MDGGISFIKACGLFFIALCFVQCSPKLRFSLQNPQPSFSDEAEVIVLPLDDNQELNGIEVGVLRASDNGLFKDCTYPEMIALL